MSSILIITDPHDTLTRLVTQALARKKAAPIRWFPKNKVCYEMSSFFLDNESPSAIRLKGSQAVDLSQVQVVWDRSSSIAPQQNMTPSSENGFIMSEQKKFIHAIYQILSPKTPWINPLFAQYNLQNKAIPLIEAIKLGLNIPNTLLTNDRDAIIEFIKEYSPTQTLYKTFTSPCWIQNNVSFDLKPVPVSPTMLPKKAIMRLSPGIYQKKQLAKRHVIVIMMGSKTHAFQISNIVDINWADLRRYQDLNIQTYDLPEAFKQQCHRLKKKLKLEFGFCHFIVSTQGEPVLIGMYDSPVFLWLEKYLPEYPLLDYFCDFILGYTKNVLTQQPAQNTLSLPEIITSRAYQTLLQRDQYQN